MTAKKENLIPSAEKNQRARKVRTIVFMTAVAALFLLLTYYVGMPLVRKFQESPEAFRAYVESHRVLGSLLMVGLVMLQVIVAFIPGEPFELGAGFVFGWWQGALLCLAGAALASALVYLAVRKWGVRLIEVFFPKEKMQSFSFLKNEKKLNLLVFMLFLIPGTPKDMLTYLVGLTPMRLSSFLILTTIARIPSAVSSTLTGSMTQQGNYLSAAIAYGVTLAVSAVCALWYRRMSKTAALVNQN